MRGCRCPSGVSVFGLAHFLGHRGRRVGTFDRVLENVYGIGSALSRAAALGVCPSVYNAACSSPPL
jgi:hypothetical protein